ncbi:MAG: BMP family ABC transporter substrate-binding protein [Candidatus Sericytochromatia bacterium]|nr:BMP family ABC transporter substrate-binding protein [Candidatus Tanganyikabacteria bacterium]
MKSRALLPALFISLFTALPSQAATFKVGLVTDVGGLNDGSFNMLAGQGLKRAKQELKVKSGVIESKQLTDYEKNLSQLATSKYDLVISVGFMMGDATKKVAQRFPGTRFAIIDFNYPDTLPNVAGVTFAEEQAGYLAGALASLESKTGKVGFVGGMDVPVIHRFKIGYEEGVKAGNKKVKVLSGYTGKFDDPAKGREVATAQYQQGADIVFHASGQCGLGVIDAAKAAKKLAIGVDADQHKVAPEYVLSSAMKRVDLAVYQLISDAVTGKFKGGNTKLTLKEGAVGLAPFYDHKVAPATQKRLDELEAALAAGKIKISLGKAAH